MNHYSIKGDYIFDSLDLCYLPDGEVMLYVKSSSIKILLDWSAKGEVSNDYDESIVSSRGEETMEEYYEASIELIYDNYDKRQNYFIDDKEYFQG